MDELGGRPHWGKRHFQTAATLARATPLGSLPGGAPATSSTRTGVLRQRVDVERVTWGPCPPRGALPSRAIDEPVGTGSSASNELRRTWSHHLRSSIWTPSGPTGRYGTPRRDPSRFGSPASRCAAGRCSSACSRGPVSRARSRTHCRRRSGSLSTARGDILVAYPSADRGALRALVDAECRRDRRAASP